MFKISFAVVFGLLVLGAYCYTFRPRSRERFLVMNVRLHNEKIITLFCYNVAVLAVLYKLNRREFIAKSIGSAEVFTGVTLPRLSTP